VVPSGRPLSISTPIAIASYNLDPEVPSRKREIVFSIVSALDVKSCSLSTESLNPITAPSPFGPITVCVSRIPLLRTSGSRGSTRERKGARTPHHLPAGQEHTLRLLRRLAQPRPPSVSGAASLLFSPNRNYYHSLVDNLARVCALGLSPLASTGVEVLYSEPLTAVERHVLDRMRPPNVSLRPLPSPGLVRAEHLVLPSFPAWRYSGWLPSWYVNQLRRALLPDRPPRRSERVFIVRRGLRRLTNEEDLLRRLDRHGFRPVELERLPFPQQVELFYDAEAIVAAHGAGLTNLLFAERALVVELSPTRCVFPHYVLMSMSLGHHHRLVLGTRQTRWEEFEADPSAVEHEFVAGLEFLRHQHG